MVNFTHILQPITGNAQHIGFKLGVLILINAQMISIAWQVTDSKSRSLPGLQYTMGDFIWYQSSYNSN